MTDATAHDPSESAPPVERTSVLAVGDLEAHDVGRALVVLAGVRAEALAPLARSAAVTGGVALTHRVPAGAVSIASLRAHGPLRTGHVLAVGVAVLEALVALHDAGLAHGAVDGGSVLVGPDGGVVLAATGAAWHAAPGEPGGPTAADDVADAGALVRDLLGSGSAPAPLVVAVVRAVDPDLALRPDAATLLDALRRCGRPDSLLDALWAPRTVAGSPTPAGLDRTVGVSAEVATADVPGATPPAAADGPAPVRPSSLRVLSTSAAEVPRRRRSSSGRRAGAAGRRTAPWRLFALAALAGTVVASAYAVSARVPGSAPPTAAAAATQPTTQPSGPVVGPSAVTATPASAVPADVAWDVVLAEVDRGRTGALAAGSPERLREFVTGTAYLEDVALARAIAASGARLDGGSLVLEQVSPLSVATTTAVLRVRDRRTAYAVVVGGTRQEVPERAARTWTVTLVRGGSPVRWRIAEVADAVLSPEGRR